MSTNASNHTSELSRSVTFERFKTAFEAFLEQADKNAATRKANGGKKPFGFTEYSFDGANFTLHFGQGTASATPYMNWWVLSIYYVVDEQNIVMGIEETRYPHLNKMESGIIKYRKIGNKKEQVAVFYESKKSDVHYGELYEKFITAAEEIIKLGVVDKNTAM